MIFKLAGTGIVAVAILASSFAANAADMGRPQYRTPVYTAPVVSSWSGFYLGVSGGIPFGTTGASETGLPLGDPAANGDYALDHKLKGWQASGTLGYNWLLGAALIGAEVDFGASDINGKGEITGTSVTTRGGIGGGIGNLVNATEKIDAFGTARLRAGWVMNDLLLYGTGGLAAGHVKYDGQFLLGALNFPASETKMKMGWTAGAGAEYRLWNRWSVKAEYLYFDLGKQSIVSPTTGNQSQFDFKTHGSLGRVGVNYRF